MSKRERRLCRRKQKERRNYKMKGWIYVKGDYERREEKVILS